MPENTSVNLTASADNISVFCGWTGGGCFGRGQCALMMDHPQSVTASFLSIANAFGDEDGDGFSNCREFLSGSDAKDVMSIPEYLADLVVRFIKTISYLIKDNLRFYNAKQQESP